MCLWLPGLHHKALHTGWLKITEMYCLTVLEARSLRSRHGRAGSFWALWEPSRPLLSPGSWSRPELLSVPCLGYIPASLSSPSHAVPPESSQDCLYKQTSVIGSGAHPIQVWLSLNLNNYICKAPISKEVYIVRYEGLGLQYIFTRCLLLGRKAMKNLDSILKSRHITLQTKVRMYSRSHGFSGRHVRMWELDRKEGWAPKNWCFWTVVLENTLESPLDCKEIKPVNQSPLNTHWKDWCWSWSFNTLATWCEELTHWKRLWCWERLRAGE